MIFFISLVACRALSRASQGSHDPALCRGCASSAWAAAQAPTRGDERLNARSPPATAASAAASHARRQPPRRRPPLPCRRPCHRLPPWRRRLRPRSSRRRQRPRKAAASSAGHACGAVCTVRSEAGRRGSERSDCFDQVNFHVSPAAHSKYTIHVPASTRARRA